MQVEDDHDTEVYNGDVGFILRIDAEAGELTATFDRREVGLWMPSSQGGSTSPVMMAATAAGTSRWQRNLPVSIRRTRNGRPVVLDRAMGAPHAAL